MKKIAFILGLLLFCSQTILADEVISEQTANDNRATIAIQKQPTKEQGQKQEAKQNKWCIIIQVNGKVKEQ